MSETIQPKPVRFITRGAVLHGFTFTERLKLLFGYRVLALNIIGSEHNPGAQQIRTHTVLTRETDMKGAIARYEESERVEALARAKAHAAKSGASITS